MHYGATVRCLDNIEKWIKLREIIFEDELYSEFVIAVTRQINGDISYEKIIIPEDLFILIKENNLEFFIEIEGNNYITVYYNDGRVLKYASFAEAIQRKKLKYEENYK